jgi:hypothetical protein
MAAPFDQVLRQQRFTQAHPEWSIHAHDWATRYLAEKDDGPNCHVVAALSLKELLNRLEEIVAAQ